jgi:hypothetical protein
MLLRQFTQVDRFLDKNLPSGPRGNIPRPLLCVFHETYLSDLSETFSKASHEGQYDLALDVGTIMLALYTIIYPPNYPQTGKSAIIVYSRSAWI